MESLFEVVANHGLMGVFGVVILGIFYLIVKYLGNKLDEGQADTIKGIQDIATTITDNMTKQNTELISKISSQQEKLIDFIIGDKNNGIIEHNDMLRERMQLTEDIKDKLRDIMHIHHAQRAFIIEFHNSYQNLTGIPFAKFSCTYEWFEKGLQSLQKKILNLPFSTMSKVIKEMLDTPNYIILYDDMEKMEKENPSLFSLCKDPKTKALIYSGMFDNKNQLIGCLILEYQKELPQNIMYNDLLLETAELTQVINLRYKYQNDE